MSTIGPYGTPSSHEAYARTIAISATITPSAHVPTDLAVSHLVLAYLRYAESYYTKDGKPNKEFTEICYALRPLRKLFGGTLVAEFGPVCLKAIQKHLIHEENLSRGVINRRINRIRRCFKWGTSEQLVPSNVYNGLRAVDGLRRGRTEAREAPKVMPVETRWVDAVLPHLAPQVRVRSV